jgi:hypothetical protein
VASNTSKIYFKPIQLFDRPYILIPAEVQFLARLAINVKPQIRKIQDEKFEYNRFFRGSHQFIDIFVPKRLAAKCSIRHCYVYESIFASVFILTRNADSVIQKIFNKLFFILIYKIQEKEFKSFNTRRQA